MFKTASPPLYRCTPSRLEYHPIINTPLPASSGVIIAGIRLVDEKVLSVKLPPSYQARGPVDLRVESADGLSTLLNNLFNGSDFLMLRQRIGGSTCLVAKPEQAQSQEQLAVDVHASISALKKDLIEWPLRSSLWLELGHCIAELDRRFPDEAVHRESVTAPLTRRELPFSAQRCYEWAVLTDFGNRHTWMTLVNHLGASCRSRFVRFDDKKEPRAFDFNRVEGLALMAEFFPNDCEAWYNLGVQLGFGAIEVAGVGYTARQCLMKALQLGRESDGVLSPSDEVVFIQSLLATLDLRSSDRQEMVKLAKRAAVLDHWCTEAWQVLALTVAQGDVHEIGGCRYDRGQCDALAVPIDDHLMEWEPDDDADAYESQQGRAPSDG